MAQYKYLALTAGGDRVNGTLEALTESDAANAVRESYGILLKLAPVREKKSFLEMEIGGNRLDTKAFTMVCSQFAIILDAGIPVARAVKLVADKTTDKPLKRMLDAVAKDVEGGRSLSASFGDHGGKLLPPTFMEMMNAGESTGNLSSSFAAMRDHFDKQTKTRAKVKSAMAYPSFVMVIAVAVVVVMMSFVVPKFMTLFEDMDMELPLITRMLIAVADFFAGYWWLIAGIAVAVVVFIKLYGSTEKGKINLAKLSLKLPIIGNIQDLNASSQFCNTMHATLAAGLPMTRAVSITAKVLDNYYIRTEALKLTEQIETGRSLADAMEESGIFQPILVDMCSVGERSGEMERTLRTVSTFYDAELDEAVKSALAKLEPALLVFIAAVAGFIVIAIYLAIFSMYGGM